MQYPKGGFLCLITILAATFSLPASEPEFTRQLDIIYHKQDGFALTMDKVSPKSGGNRAAVVIVMSGGWFSNHEFTKPHDVARLPGFLQQHAVELLNRGFTLFYVVHGTQPKFTIREIHGQISAAVRYIRHHNSQYDIDANRIGIMGGSAGGHLSLMQGTKGEKGKSAAETSAEESSKVQAVVAYYPPTDFVNYGNENVFFDKVVREVIPEGKNPFLQALDYLEFDEENIRLNKVTDDDRLAEHYKEIAPAYHVTDDDAPTLLLHGDADRLVPIQQSMLIAAKFKEVGIPHRLFLKEGAGHGWSPPQEETAMVVDWFDQHLTK